MAQSIGANSYASHEEMADAESLDAVVVCTPPVTHRNICADLANRGLHVLCKSRSRLIRKARQRCSTSPYRTRSS
ncbi:MAG: Gfo/Idh/MocA family oxidoreductase [Planctomycetales bacterium]